MNVLDEHSRRPFSTSILDSERDLYLQGSCPFANLIFRLMETVKTSQQLSLHASKSSCPGPQKCWVQKPSTRREIQRPTHHPRSARVETIFL